MKKPDQKFIDSLNNRKSDLDLEIHKLKNEMELIQTLKDKFTNKDQDTEGEPMLSVWKYTGDISPPKKRKYKFANRSKKNTSLEDRFYSTMEELIKHILTGPIWSKDHEFHINKLVRRIGLLNLSPMQKRILKRNLFACISSHPKLAKCKKPRSGIYINKLFKK